VSLETPEWARELVGLLRVEPGAKVRLGEDFDPGFVAEFVKEKDAPSLLTETVERVASYQTRLAAENARGLLLCLQGLDASGKDSTIRHVLSGVNPQGVRVSSFKEPSVAELRHDFLWRYAQNLPAHGEIGVFNRSHYEEVLVVRVHPDLLASRNVSPSEGEHLWKRRFREINDWERYISDNAISVQKVCLNLSKEEQRARFLRRLDLPDHNWKFTASDIRERTYWDDYHHAYSEVLSHTSTKWAPWYVVPADHKWFARVCVSVLLLDALRTLDPQFPSVSAEQQREEAEAKAALLAEAPDGHGTAASD
jgi:PPK2 family polyphosphate:nucleotide phosphotransferase